MRQPPSGPGVETVTPTVVLVFPMVEFGDDGIAENPGEAVENVRLFLQRLGVVIPFKRVLMSKLGYRPSAAYTWVV